MLCIQDALGLLIVEDGSVLALVARNKALQRKGVVFMFWIMSLLRTAVRSDADKDLDRFLAFARVASAVVSYF